MLLNYQPIALMPVLYKLVSKIITSQLYNAVEVEGLLLLAQGGFWKQRSMLSHVHALHGCLEDAKKCNARVYVAYVDIANVYDSVPRWVLLCMLARYNVLGNVLHFIDMSLVGSTLSVLTCFGPMDPFETEVGVKQGDLMLPLLFLLFINLVVHQIMESGCGYMLSSGEKVPILAFVDDLALLVDGMDDMEYVWNTLTQFYYEHGMWVNVGKLVLTSNWPLEDD